MMNFASSSTRRKTRGSGSSQVVADAQLTWAMLRLASLSSAMNTTDLCSEHSLL